MSNTEARNALNWFEIAVSDMDRAKKFYSHVLNSELTTEDFFGTEMSILPYQDGVGGSLMKSENHKPSTEGSVVFLNAGPDMAPYLTKVEEAGGQTVMPRTAIGPNGFIAVFLDSEGNKVGFHSPT